MLAVPATAVAAIPARGKVKLAMVKNSYFDAHHNGFVPSTWQVQHCTSAVTSGQRWDWGSWVYTGGRRERCLALLSSPFPVGLEFMKIERGYWHNVMGLRRGNPCFQRSDRGQPRVPWDVIDDLLQGVSCPSAPGW